MEQPRGRGHGEQRADLVAAARLAEDHDVAGITAEAGDVVAHPPEGGDEVEHPGVAADRERLAAELGQIQVAEGVEPMVDGDDDAVVLAGEVRAVVPPPRARAHAEPAAVDAEQHRARPVVGRRRPDVEDEAVLALDRLGVGHAEHRPHLGGPPALGRTGALRARGAGRQRVAYARPRRRRVRRQEPRGDARVGDAQEDGDVAGTLAAHLARLGLHDHFGHVPSISSTVAPPYPRARRRPAASADRPLTERKNLSVLLSRTVLAWYIDPVRFQEGSHSKEVPQC